MATFPLINGLERDWSSVEISVSGGDTSTIYFGCKELTWSQSREPGVVRGAGSAKKLARTRGEYDAEGTMVMWSTQADELIAQLKLIGDADGLGWMEVSVDITISFTSPGVPFSVVKLEGVNLISDEGGGSQGTDPLERSFDLDILDIDDNGARAVGVVI